MWLRLSADGGLQHEYPEPRIFRSFVALADTQSFTEAAKRMGMTTSAASQALKALEEELAVALISRKAAR